MGRDEVKYQIQKRRERFLMWIAWHMPREIVKWCFIRLAAHATTSEFANRETPTVTCMEALACWDTTHGI